MAYSFSFLPDSENPARRRLIPRLNMSIRFNLQLSAIVVGRIGSEFAYPDCIVCVVAGSLLVHC